MAMFLSRLSVRSAVCEPAQLLILNRSLLPAAPRLVVITPHVNEATWRWRNRLPGAPLLRGLPVPCASAYDVERRNGGPPETAAPRLL